MTSTADSPPPIVRRGPIAPCSPVVITVPHAGRCYDEALLRAARLPQTALATLEDRYADALIDDAVADSAVGLIATTARAWIDLNRDPREIDPAMIEPPSPPRGAYESHESAKLRGGLGLIPRRIAQGGDIWRRRLTSDEVSARIAAVHAPWHAAIAEALIAARTRFGFALLIDCHSMPPLPGDRPARLVLGDAFGRSADGRITESMAAAAEARGIDVARNAPYAGGYTIQHHARPDGGIHAIQIELCRTLYLDAGLKRPGPGLATARTLIAALARVGRAALEPRFPETIAAE